MFGGSGDLSALRKRWGFLAVGIGILLVGIVGMVLKRSPNGVPRPEVYVTPPKAEVSSEGPPDLAHVKALLAKAENARVQGSLLEAKRLYQEILQQAPPTAMANTVGQRLGQVSVELILSPILTPEAVTHVVEPGDTLSKIAKQHRTTVELLKAANGLKSDRIRVGQRLKAMKADFSVIVDKSQNTLTLKQGEEVVKVYRCSTGQGGMTPSGSFKIVNRIVDPPWFTPDGVIPPGDPRNILGSRWLGFDLASYGIHGTTDPASIGRQVTQGCVRLNNAEVEELFILLPEGTPVTIVE